MCSSHVVSSCAIGIPYLPLTRVTPAMLNCNHDNNLPAEAEVHVVGKLPDQGPPGVTMSNRKLEWRLDNGTKSC
jgi:hypothetical protein